MKKSIRDAFSLFDCKKNKFNLLAIPKVFEHESCYDETNCKTKESDIITEEAQVFAELSNVVVTDEQLSKSVRFIFLGMRLYALLLPEGVL